MMFLFGCRSDNERGSASYLNVIDQAEQEQFEIDYGNSDKFTEEEIKSAIKCVTNNFTFPDSILTKLWYDESKSSIDIKFYLENGRGATNGVQAENVIVIYTDFVTGSNNPVLSKGEHTNYMWILIRDSGESAWMIDDQGY